MAIMGGVSSLHIWFTYIFYCYNYENNKKDDEIRELKKLAKDALLNKKNDIVLDSSDVDDCVSRMNDAVDGFILHYVNNDDFFNCTLLLWKNIYLR